jgi:predicted PurR-regulated permease PerM
VAATQYRVGLMVRATLDAPTFTDAQRDLGRLIKLAALVIIALAVIYTAMDRLEAIIIPFMLALALAYLLTPLIDCLSCKGARCSLRLPHGLAVLIAILVACGVLFFIGAILLQALTTFRQRSSVYRARVEDLLETIFQMLTALQRYIGSVPPAHNTTANVTAVHDHLADVSRLVESFLGQVHPHLPCPHLPCHHLPWLEWT